MSAATKRKNVPKPASDSDSDGDENFDVMEFNALSHGKDERVDAIKRVQEARGINNVVCFTYLFILPSTIRVSSVLTR